MVRDEDAYVVDRLLSFSLFLFLATLTLLSLLTGRLVADNHAECSFHRGRRERAPILATLAFLSSISFRGWGLRFRGEMRR